MNSRLSPGDPTLVAAFRSALLHQGAIALLILVFVWLLWATARTWRSAAIPGKAAATAGGPSAGGPSADGPSAGGCGRGLYRRRRDLAVGGTDAADGGPGTGARPDRHPGRQRGAAGRRGQ